MEEDQADLNSKLILRIQKATGALRQARSEIEKLKREKEDLLNRMGSMAAVFKSRMETQKSELQHLQTQFADTRSMVDGYVTTLNKTFQTLVEKSKRSLEDVRYENKLVSDQLEVKKLKLTHLTKRMEAQTKQMTKLKRLNAKFTSGDKDGALVMRCIRCKVRKNVIKKLERELVDAVSTKDAAEQRANVAVKAKDDAESRYGRAKADLSKIKDQLVQQKRINVILEQDLSDQRKKTAALELEAQEAAQHHAAVVEVGRTPTEQQLYPHHSRQSQSSSPDFEQAGFHAKCQQYASELRTSLETKQVEFEQLSSERQRLIAELVFYRQRVEELTLDLETSISRCDQKETELNETKQQVQLLQALLENLAAGIVTAIAD